MQFTDLGITLFGKTFDFICCIIIVKIDWPKIRGGGEGINDYKSLIDL